MHAKDCQFKKMKKRNIWHKTKAKEIEEMDEHICVHL